MPRLVVVGHISIGVLVLVVVTVAVVVVGDAVVVVRQGAPRGCARQRSTNVVGVAPSAVESLIRPRRPTATSTRRSEHATSPHTRIANVHVPSQT